MAQTYTVDPYVGTGKSADAVMDDVNENFAALKSSFSGTSAPSNPIEGQFWLDTTNDILKQYIDSDWVSIYDTADEILLLPVDTYEAGSVDATALANNAVTTDKINAGAVTAAKMADGILTNAKLADFAVGNYSFTGASWIGGYEDQGTYVTVGEFIVTRAGNIRVRVRYKTDSAAEDGYYRLSQNGTPFYTSSSYSNSTSWSYRNHDISVSVGDVISLELRQTDVGEDNAYAGMIGCCDAPTNGGANVSYLIFD